MIDDNKKQCPHCGAVGRFYERNGRMYCGGCHIQSGHAQPLILELLLEQQKRAMLADSAHSDPHGRYMGWRRGICEGLLIAQSYSLMDAGDMVDSWLKERNVDLGDSLPRVRRMEV